MKIGGVCDVVVNCYYSIQLSGLNKFILDNLSSNIKFEIRKVNVIL